MRRCALVLLWLAALPALSQSNTGEIRLSITDSSGHAVRAEVQIVSEASQYSETFTTDGKGDVDARRLPYGIYQVGVEAPSFAPVSELVAVRSAAPVERSIHLEPGTVSQSVTVHATGTLIDPWRAGSVNEMGHQTIENRMTSIPGRSIQDLINSEPGWLYEGNAVLHPRGSEYQTQFVVDGIPLTDNRSPGFGPGLLAGNIQSLTIYTAGFPAEYGRKLGGVVVVNTLRNEEPGLHGHLTLLGGSYSTAGIDTQDEYTRRRNTVGLSAAGNMTGHYLNPVVPENYTNHGTTGSFSLSYERQFTPKNHLTLIASHDLARYEIPNELVQQNGAWLPNANNTTGCPTHGPEPGDCVFIPGGQLQTGDNFETMGIASWEHIVSPRVVTALHGMARGNSNDFSSNPSSWPLIATQHNGFTEIYFNGSVSIDRGNQEWKTGVESDSKFLSENFSYLMPDCGMPADPRCPISLGTLDAGATSFAFQGSRPDLEQAAYVQDAIQIGNWSVEAGLRWDHYQLMVNQNAVSPRLALSRYFPSAGVKVHVSWDRIFQTPSFENIILSSSRAAQSLDTTIPAVQLPVEPSRGNYYELGATKAFFAKVRLDTNIFRRDVNNYADDSQILSTGISFPIAFRKAVLYGAEGKLEIHPWGRFSGFASYSYIVGNAWYPVTGGLFLGDDAASAATQFTGHFPDSQDQRNTVRGRILTHLNRRLWFALEGDYNSGLPFQPDQTRQQYAAEYGPVLISHLNFTRDRVSPRFTQDATVSAELWQRDQLSVRFQADGENLSNELDLIDFGGLFSGNAIGPGRMGMLRLVTTF